MAAALSVSHRGSDPLVSGSICKYTTYLRSLSMITSTGSLKRATCPPCPPLAGASPALDGSSDIVMYFSLFQDFMTNTDSYRCSSLKLKSTIKVPSNTIVKLRSAITNYYKVVMIGIVNAGAEDRRFLFGRQMSLQIKAAAHRAAWKWLLVAL